MTDKRHKQSSSRFMDRKRAAAWLGISLRTLDELVRRKEIPSFKIRNRRMFDPWQLKRWVRTKQQWKGD